MTKRTVQLRAAIDEHYKKYGCKSAMAHFGLTKSQVKEISRWYRKRVKKTISALTPEKINYLRLKAYKLALKHLSEFHAEDFSSFVCIRLLEGSRATLNQMLIDFKRLKFGHTNSPYNDVKKNLEKAGEYKENEKGYTISDSIFDDIITELKIDDSRKRAILYLRFVYGFNDAEISKIFGIEQARTSVIFKKLFEYILTKKDCFEID